MHDIVATIIILLPLLPGKVQRRGLCLRALKKGLWGTGEVREEGGKSREGSVELREGVETGKDL